MTTDISVKINNYIQSKGLSESPTEQVLSDMVSEGVLTQAEYNYAIENHIFGTISQQTTVGDTVIVSDSTQQTPQPTQTRKAHHPVFKELELDSSGRIDMGQFESESIKQKYANKNVDIKVTKEDNTETTTITDKNTHKILIEISKEIIGNETEYTLTCFNKFGVKDNNITVSDGIIISNTQFNPDGTSTTTVYEDGDLSKISERIQTAKDGSSTKTYFNNSEKTMVLIYDKDGNFVKGTKYAGGQAYADCDEYENNLDNFLLTEIILDFDEQNIDAEKLYSDFKTRITASNITDMIKEYYDETEHYLLNDIENCDKLTDTQKQELITYLQKVMSSAIDDPPQDAKLKDDISNDIRNNDYEALKVHLLSTNEDNILNIIQSFGVYANDTDLVGKRSLTNPADIIQRSDMPDTDKKQCIDHLASTLQKHTQKKGINTKDIFKDMASHPDNFDLFRVDFKRLVSRASTEPSVEKVTTPDCKTDLNFIQGGTGDCWIISGLRAILNKPWGKQVLDNMLSVDNENKTITVTFADNRSYTITFDEVDEANHLATGNGNIRAIEIAIDRYMRDDAYDKAPFEVSDKEILQDPPGDLFDDDSDIEAYSSDFLFKLILGNGEIVDDTDFEKTDFNNENAVFTFATEDNNIEGITETTNEPEFLSTSHSYTILKSDNNYIYLQDPTEEANHIIKVKKSALKDADTTVECATYK